MPEALYLHVPFCPKICPYCDFHKMRRHEPLVARYLERLEQEATDLHSEFPSQLKTIYLGGGTPSHLSDEELTRVVSIFERTWGWAAEEATLEADPLTFDKARLETFKALGFNRLSIGLQSTQDEVLKFLGRLHSAEEGLRAVEMALNAGFEVSADLITAVTGQDTAQDLRTLAETGVPHISVYNLTIEPYTPFALRGVQVDEEKEAHDFELANEVLQGYGFERYEVSSHAKPGHESRHNQTYWHGDYFLALGPSAAGFLPVRGEETRGGGAEEQRSRGAEEQEGKGLLSFSPPAPLPPCSPAQCFSRLVSEVPSLRLPHPSPPIGERRTNVPIKSWLEHAPPERLMVSPEDYVLDVLMTGLRTQRGVDLAKLAERTGIRVGERYASLIETLTARGLLEFTPPRLRATSQGLSQLNGILKKFFAVSV